ncbi:uncharacterized protein N7458_005013 [Penicillium daleae]|uniref:Clr5 domain-containing protein n=1 Tax=Penicillium daleae TaxID=63821 RepID=A0AAD6C9X7_9EURO|nr:uncharacterized protein N7458_005013 [Penicillium daleae]KAJ5454057.1 hypothetical protein N7458_005013 [Penicillium daleae]
MPRPQIDLEPYREEITLLYSQNARIANIQTIIQSHGVNISLRTLKTRLSSWGLRRQLPSQNEALHARLLTLITEAGLSARETLEVLQKEGFRVSEPTLERLRKRLGIQLRTNCPLQRQQQRLEIEVLLTEELGIGDVEGYGRRILYHHLRRHGFLFPQHRVFEVYRSLRPDSLLRRSYDLQRSRGEYWCPGPNFVWHVDGYMKLAQFGVEVYAAIDGYSRYILWIYVGISTRTAVSVLSQFLDTLAELSYQPEIIRSDLGSETSPYWGCTMGAAAEAWWAQLSKSCTFLYYQYFRELREQGLFSGSIPEQVALLAVYMPTLRRVIGEYAKTWNIHNIRKQKSRPNAVTGKPFMNYFNASKPDYQRAVDQMLLRELQEDVRDWDKDEYLPPDVLAWCHQQLQEIGAELYGPGNGFNPDNPPSRVPEEVSQPYRVEYLELRRRALLHDQLDEHPVLCLTTKPLGAWDWEPGEAQEG